MSAFADDDDGHRILFSEGRGEDAAPVTPPRCHTRAPVDTLSHPPTPHAVPLSAQADVTLVRPGNMGG